LLRTRVFIGSAQANIKVARLVASVLEHQNLLVSVVWNEDVFRLNESILSGLLRAVREFDYAVLVWGPDDVTESRGVSLRSPRDNVIFETGLFLGALGPKRVFVVCEKRTKVKIPSDFAGITLTYYDGSLIETDDRISAVREACDQIVESIQRSTNESQREAPYAGKWRSKYVEVANPSVPVIVDQIEITVIGTDINIISETTPGGIPYKAHGQIHRNQILGKWEHQAGRSLAEGLFLLTVSPLADVMYGYSTNRDATGAMVYGTWVLAREEGSTEEQVNARLEWGSKELKTRTLAPSVGE
jgi:hypothetical protein